MTFLFHVFNPEPLGWGLKDDRDTTGIIYRVIYVNRESKRRDARFSWCLNKVGAVTTSNEADTPLCSKGVRISLSASLKLRCEQTYFLDKLWVSLNGSKDEGPWLATCRRKGIEVLLSIEDMLDSVQSWTKLHGE